MRFIFNTEQLRNIFRHRIKHNLSELKKYENWLEEFGYSCSESHEVKINVSFHRKEFNKYTLLLDNLEDKKETKLTFHQIEKLDLFSEFQYDEG